MPHCEVPAISFLSAIYTSRSRGRRPGFAGYRFEIRQFVSESVSITFSAISSTVSTIRGDLLDLALTLYDTFAHDLYSYTTPARKNLIRPRFREMDILTLSTPATPRNFNTGRSYIIKCRRMYQFFKLPGADNKAICHELQVEMLLFALS